MKKGFNFDIPSPTLDTNANFTSESQSFTINPRGAESFVPVTSSDSNGNQSLHAADSDPVLKYLQEILLEENMEHRSEMFPDQSALKATEKSLYDLLGERVNSQDCIAWESGDAGSSSCCGGSDNLDPSVFSYSLPNNNQFRSVAQSSEQSCVNSMNGASDFSEGLTGSSVSEMMQNMFRNEESMLQFKRGLEEASKFLPNASQLILSSGSNSSASAPMNEPLLVPAAINGHKSKRRTLPNCSQGWKEHKRYRSDLEDERSNKQSAVCVEETELSEMFDKVLLWPSEEKDNQSVSSDRSKQNGVIETSQLDKQTNLSNGEKVRSKSQEKKKEAVDLRSLLILCAQAVSRNDFEAANELLKEIKENSSPIGDGSQRMAHFFANGLEARMSGTGIFGLPNIYASLVSKKLAATDMLISYKIHRQAFPFTLFSVLYANEMIMEAVESASTLHIIDFGILYGFKFPCLIQQLSKRKGGPPKLRVTGIELPQHGFRPAGGIEETGCRLARYCKRFRVPFEFNAIASKNWEGIAIDEFKIGSNEVVVVNCQYRFSCLYDETVQPICQRDLVLKLIRKMNPNIFTHTITNASCNAPFFLTRFKEALFHFSSLFDMFDTILPRDDKERLMFEREDYGRELINIIACEGLERVDRHETYKQWQVRTTRAGFKSVPLNEDVFRDLRGKLSAWYHRDYVMDKDGDWLLQGWKGRIISGSSCWVPV